MTTRDDTIIDTQTDIKIKVKKPKRYAVIFHNDDFTAMAFVVYLLMNVFHKNQDDATAIMMKVHLDQRAIVDIFTKEIAVEKVDTTMKTASANGYPLIASFEPYDEDEE